MYFNKEVDLHQSLSWFQLYRTSQQIERKMLAVKEQWLVNDVMLMLQHYSPDPKSFFIKCNTVRSDVFEVDFLVIICDRFHWDVTYLLLKYIWMNVWPEGRLFWSMLHSIQQCLSCHLRQCSKLKGFTFFEDVFRHTPEWGHLHRTQKLFFHPLTSHISAVGKQWDMGWWGVFNSASV